MTSSRRGWPLGVRGLEWCGMRAAPGEGPLDDPAAREHWPPPGARIPRARGRWSRRGRHLSDHGARARSVSADQHTANPDNAVTNGCPANLSSIHQVPHLCRTHQVPHGSAGSVPSRARSAARANSFRRRGELFSKAVICNTQGSGTLCGLFFVTVIVFFARRSRSCWRRAVTRRWRLP